jgi:hypothetical protein
MWTAGEKNLKMKRLTTCRPKNNLGPVGLSNTTATNANASGFYIFKDYNFFLFANVTLSFFQFISVCSVFSMLLPTYIINQKVQFFWTNAFLKADAGKVDKVQVQK